MKKIILCLIASFFALSMWGAQYCETVITGTSANHHQAKITCQSLGGNRYEFVFESVDPFTGYNAAGSNFHANSINGTEGQQVSAHLVQDGNKLTWTVESTTVPNIYVGDFYVNYSNGEEHYNIPVDEDFSLECSDTRDYVITAYVPDGNEAPWIHFWGEGFAPGSYPRMVAEGHSNTFVYTVENAPKSGIQVLFTHSDKNTADQAKITDDACYDVYWDGDAYTARPTSCHEMRDVKITVNATSQPSLYYWGMPNGGITYDAPIVMPAKVGVPSGWYEYTIENVDALSGVNYLIRMESNGKTTDQNTKANVVKNAIYHGDWGDHKVELTDASYPQYYSNLTLTSATSVDLFAGNTSQITYTTISTGAFTYSSDDDGVATVSASGLITAVAAGTTTIRFSQAADANYLASEEKTVTVTVTADPSYPSEKGFGTYQGRVDLFDWAGDYAGTNACGQLDLYVVTWGDDMLFKAKGVDKNFEDGTDWKCQLRTRNNELADGAREFWGKRVVDAATRISEYGNTYNNHRGLAGYGDQFKMWSYMVMAGCGARTMQTITYRRDYINNPISDEVAPVLTSASAEEVDENVVITLSQVTSEEVFYMIKDAEHNAIHYSLVPTFTLPKDGSGVTYNYSCYAVDFNGNMSAAREVQITMPFDVNQNLALNKFSTAGWDAANAGLANNGITGDNRWGSRYGSHPDDDWWVVDLGESYNLSRIELVWEGACSTDFVIKGSDTKPTSWNDLAQYESLIVSYQGTPVADMQTANLHDASGSHARYLILKSAACTHGCAYGISIVEFRVFGTGIYGASGQLDAPTNVNVTDGTLTFDVVANATSYEAHVYDGATKVATQDNVDPTGTALTYIPASNKSLTVKVVAKGAGYLNSDESAAAAWHFEYQNLATPTGLAVTPAGVLTFTAVEHAASYKVTVFNSADELLDTQTESIDPAGTTLAYAPTANGTYKVKVQAIATPGEGYNNSAVSEAANWVYSYYLAVPTNLNLNTETGAITFTGDANATSFEAYIYLNSVEYAHQTITSGGTLTRPAVANDAYVIKIKAVGTAPYITSPESAGVEWYIAGKPRLAEPSVYCSQKMIGVDGNWVDDATSAVEFTWETMNDGSIVISIAPQTGKESVQTLVEFRGETPMNMEDFYVGNTKAAAGAYFDIEHTSTQVVLRLKSDISDALLEQIPYGTKIYYGMSETSKANIEYKTQPEGNNSNLYPNFFFEYTYGTYCDDSKVFVSTQVNNNEWGSAKVQQGGEDVTFINKGEAATFVATPAGEFVFDSWTDSEGNVVSTQRQVTINNINENYSLTANFDYARTTYCQKPVLCTGALAGRTLYVSFGETSTPGTYFILIEGSEDAKLTSMTNANWQINGVDNGLGQSGQDVPFSIDNGKWTFSTENYGSARTEFTLAAGSTWRDIYMWNRNISFTIDDAPGDCIYHEYQNEEKIDWRNTCADTEAPELEEPKYDVLSESSVRLSLKATDDRDFIRYTISGFDGGDIVVDASAGVRIYKEVSDLEPNYPYQITITASDKAGNEDSKVITVTASPDATAPFNFVASALSLSTNAIQITASADEDRVSAITYVVYDNADNLLGNVSAAPGKKAIYKVSGLDPNTAYTFKVVAQNFNFVPTEAIVVTATTHNVDLALDQTATAGMDAEHAFWSNNGNYNSRWGSNGGTHPADDWWSVDLGAVYNIENIRILWEQARAKSYSLYISDNGSVWTEIGAYNELPLFSNGAAQTDGYFMDYNDFTHRAKGRYLKVAATSTDGGYETLAYGISMWAFEAYGYPVVASDAKITAHNVVSVTSNQAVLDLTITSTNSTVDYIVALDAANGINVRCNPTMVGGKYRITIPGLTANESYNFTLVVFDTQHGESDPYTVTPAIKALATRPVIGQAPTPPFRNGGDFRSIYSDFYKPALKNYDTFSRTKWINVFYEEGDVNDDHYMLYGYNGNNREAVWGDTGDQESFLARTGGDEDPIFPALNYTDGVNTGLDIHNFTKLHVDLWADQAMTNFTVRLGDDVLVEHLAHAGTGWQSYEIDVPESKRISNLRWMKFQGFTGDYWALDNVYFYNPVDYSSMYEVRIKANIKEAGTPIIIGSDNEDRYYAAAGEHLDFLAHSAVDKGFFFVNWTNDDNGDAEISSTEPMHNREITGPTHYTANYIRKYKVVGVAKMIDNETTGTVTVVLSDASPSEVGGDKFVTPGTSATFTAAQNSPYVFKYWALDGKFYSAGANDGSHTVVYENIQRDIELRAIYDKGGTAYESTEIPTGFPEMTSTDGHLRVSYISLGGKRYRILVEGTPECCLTAAYNNFNFYVHNINGGRSGDDGRSFPASAWNENFFPYGYGYTYVDFEADDANLIKIDADRNYVVFYRTPIAEGQSHSGRDLVECKLPAMGINWNNEYRPTFPLAAKEATEGAGITWSTAAWLNTEDTPGTPNDNTDVYLLSPTTVDVATARAKSVTICTEHDGYLTGHGVVQGLVDEQYKPNFAPQKHTGHLTINADAALQVVGKVQKVERANFYNPAPTTPEDLFIASDENGNGALIHENRSGNAQATVQMYSKAHGTDDGKGNVSDAVWQWITTPYNDRYDVLRNYYGAWMFEYVNANHGWTHQMTNSSTMEPFNAYSITSGSPRTYTLEGTLVSTDDKNVALAYTNGNGINVVGNSWTAPINISKFKPGDFHNADANIILFNTGLDELGTGGAATGDADYTAATYLTIPVLAAPSMDGVTTIISSMQAFQVNATGASPSLDLNYDRLVRTEGAVNIKPMRAPSRAAAEEDNENGINEKLRIWVKGSRYSDFVYIFQHDDATNGFDNGYDGLKYLSDNWDIPMLMADMGNQFWQVSTQPALVGTQLAFMQGEDTEYTIRFEYEGDEGLWLYDSETNIYTEVNNENTYTFASDTYATQNRFILTTREAPEQPGITTGTESADQSAYRPRKVILNNQLFIMNNGCLYDAQGKMIH